MKIVSDVFNEADLRALVNCAPGDIVPVKGTCFDFIVPYLNEGLDEDGVIL